MKRQPWNWFVLALPGLLTLIVGCGGQAKSDPGANATSATSNEGATPSANATDSDSASRRSDVVPTGTTTVPSDVALARDTAPETVVTAFLDATRRGDDGLASKLLSQKALAETTRVGLAVKPPGTPTMTYAIAKTEYPTDVPDGVYVHSVWSETFEQGEEQFDVTWVLRKQDEGWRIVGMAAQMAENEPPFFLNFEQPDDLYRKMQEASGNGEGGNRADSTSTLAGDSPAAQETDTKTDGAALSTDANGNGASTSGEATARQPSGGNPLR